MRHRDELCTFRIVLRRELADEPACKERVQVGTELINQDAYENWIIKVEISDKSELDNLMDAKAYAAFCEK